MDFENLTQEQLEKAKTCTSPSELLQLAKDEGIELTEEQLDAITGGTAITAGSPEFNKDLWGKVTD